MPTTSNPVTKSPASATRSGRRFRRRRGSTLLVVIGMLGLLLLLGFTYFSFAAQEDQASQYFTEAAKTPRSDVDPFLFGIEQVLLGARAPHYHSALYTGPVDNLRGLGVGRHSLIGTMLGGDSSLYSGSGQNVVFRDDTTPDGLPDVNGGTNYPWGRDDNYDGLPDADPIVNLSIAGNGGRVRSIPGSPGSGVTLPQPDVGYTYPDANNLFLSYYGTVWDDVSGRWRRFIIPSFHRPQLMRDRTSGAPIANWASNPALAARVLRPHPNHVTTSDPFNGGNVNATNNPRYLSAGGTNALGLPVSAFPFTNLEQGVFDADVRDLDPGDAGDRTTIATRLNAQEISSGIGNGTGVNYDVDNDNDGIREGVWLDLDYPVQRLLDGRLYTVLFSFTIVDADGLINVNEAGNLSGAHLNASGIPVDPSWINKSQLLSGSPVSRSNLGATPAEVNPGYALNANPGSTADYANATNSDRATLPLRTQYNISGRRTVASDPALTAIETGNLELFMLLTGRVKFRTQNGGGLTLDGVDYIFDGSSFEEALVSGKWGETTTLFEAIWNASNAVRNSSSSNWIADPTAGNFVSWRFPRPGRALTAISPLTYALDDVRHPFHPFNQSFPDDNGNRLREVVYSSDVRFLRDSDPYLPNVLIPVPRRPSDHRGLGNYITGSANGPVATLSDGPLAPTAPDRWVAYAGYSQFKNDDADGSGQNNGFAMPWQSVDLSTTPLLSSLIDEPGETVTEPKQARTSTGDQIFGIEEMAGLHARRNGSIDDAATGGVSNFRLRQLAPNNFGDPAATSGDLGSQRATQVTLNAGETESWPQGIRNRFTVSSWDRPQSGLPTPPLQLNGTDVSRPSKAFTALTSIDRPWEYDSYPSSTTNRLQFPPRYGSGGAGVPEVLQPFRAELRTMLRAYLESPDAVDITEATFQFRRNINRLLISYWDNSQNRAIPVYRRLMPHPFNAPPSANIPGRGTMLGPDGQPGQAGFDDNGNFRHDTNTGAPILDSNNRAIAIADNDGGGNTDWGEIGAPGSDDLMPWSPVANITAAGLPASNATEEAESRARIQEFWARRDRQLMARDIYVMLYTLGGGRNRLDYSNASLDTNLGVLQTNATRAVYTNDQLEEMAQFAVNLVDALDPDDAITPFEYMRDLSNGWRLDDNPYDPNGVSDVFSPSADDGGVAAADRGVVFGVEQQTLTLSELLAIRAPYIDSTETNARHTTWDDRGTTTQARYFTYLELKNASPQAASLANRGWRIRRIDPTATDPYASATTLSILTLDESAAANTSNAIPAGGQFTIGNRSDLENDPSGVSTSGRPSLFRIDIDQDANGTFDGQFECLAPGCGYGNGTLRLSDATSDEVNQAEMNAQLPSYLDLRWSPHNSRFTLTNAGGATLGVGTWVDSGTTTDTLRFVLERRANTTRNQGADSKDNAWVIVDELVVNNAFREYTAADGDDVTALTTKLANLLSRERDQPLNRSTGTPNSNGIGVTTVRNTLDGSNGAVSATIKNSVSPASFSLIQNHFDRDFASPMELLSLPLFGPRDLTRRTALIGNTNNQPRDGSGNLTGTEYTAGKKFMRPNYTVTDGGADATGAAANPLYDNAWYRLFEFLEVPNGRNSQVQQFVKSPRTPGRLNLNTIRDAAVFAGLVDDPAMVQGYDPFLNSVGAYESGSRYWWLQFVKARDQRDPVTGLYLPGTPASRPFLGFNALPNHVARPESGVERTLLRSLAANLTNQVTYPPGVGGSPYTDIDMNDDISGDSTLSFADQRPDRRGLFEARTVNDLASQGGSNSVDPHTRHRLLHKIANNSTTRSNVFIVWVTTTRCEMVWDKTTQTYRIGGRLDGAADLADTAGDFPAERAFFVLDRSQLEEAYDARTGAFNFRKFIKYRKDL